MNQEKNLEICKLLTEFFSKPENKDLRFFQGLTNLDLFKRQFDDRLNSIGVEDPFYYRNEIVLEKVKRNAIAISYKGRNFYVKEVDFKPGMKAFAFEDSDFMKVAKIDGKTLMFSYNDIQENLIK